MPIGVGTNLDVKTGSVNVSLTNSDGNATRVSCTTATIPSGAAGYAIGCSLQDTTTGKLYYNSGTASSCTFTLVGTESTGSVDYMVVAKSTSGTTGQNVFGTTNGFAGTVTGVTLVALDGTAANISVVDTAGTVATIAKGTSTSSLVGATTLTNTAFTSTGTMQVVSSGATGDARVLITFTVP